MYAAIACILIMGTTMYVGRGAGAQIVMESEGNYLEGREAVRLDKEIAARHEGPLTEERWRRFWRPTAQEEMTGASGW